MVFAVTGLSKDLATELPRGDASYPGRDLSYPRHNEWYRHTADLRSSNIIYFSDQNPSLQFTHRKPNMLAGAFVLVIHTQFIDCDID